MSTRAENKSQSLNSSQSGEDILQGAAESSSHNSSSAPLKPQIISDNVQCMNKIATNPKLGLLRDSKEVENHIQRINYESDSKTSLNLEKPHTNTQAEIFSNTYKRKCFFLKNYDFKEQIVHCSVTIHPEKGY